MDVGKYYKSSSSKAKIRNPIAKSHREPVLKEMRESPFIGIQIDASTDISDH